MEDAFPLGLPALVESASAKGSGDRGSLRAGPGGRIQGAAGAGMQAARHD